MQTRGGSGSFKEEVTVIEGLSFIHLFGISSKYIRYFKLISSRKPNQNVMKKQPSHLPSKYINLLANSPFTAKVQYKKKKILRELLIPEFGYLNGNNKMN